VDAEHNVIAKMFEKDLIFFFLVEKKKKKQLAKKRTIAFGGSISNFFSIKDSFKKKDVPQKQI